MNYNSINELLSAGKANMTHVGNNAYGIMEIDGANWFTFNGEIVEKLYFSADSSVGFNSSEDHLKINYHTGNISNGFDREEGTLYNRYKFLKIRRHGFTVFGGDNYSNKKKQIEYDLILWETGDISLHMINVPTIGNDGEYSISTASTTTAYTVSSTKQDVTFVKTDDAFTVENNLIALDERRYLVRSNETYYTVADNALSAIAVEELTSEVFLTFGSMTLPVIDMIFDLPNPEILYWSEDSQIALNSQLIVSFTPPLPQVIYSEFYTVQDGTMIDRVVILDAKNASVSVTFDNGATWKYYHDGTWVVAESETDGMAVDVLNNLSVDQWVEAMPYTTFQVRCALVSSDSAAGELYFNLTPTNTEA